MSCHRDLIELIVVYVMAWSPTLRTVMYARQALKCNYTHGDNTR